MVVKVKEFFEKTRHIKNNDKSKKYILRGHRNVRYHEKLISNKKKSKNLNYVDKTDFLSPNSSLEIMHVIK